MNGEQAVRHLRYLIGGLLHVGRLKPGDPLPSIRGFASEVGTDHRVVAAAYRALEAEGLVVIRPGSGVYLAAGGSLRVQHAEAEESWLGEVLLEGWSRRVARHEVAALVHRCAASRVRCLCIESNEDHLEAVSSELRSDFSLDVAALLVSPSGGSGAIPRDAVAAADVVVTTVFHAEAGVRAAAAGGKPCVVLSVNPRFAAAVAQKLSQPSVTAVVADPRYVARATAYLEVTPHRDVRFLLWDDPSLAGKARLNVDGESVLATRAARRRLGLPEYHLVPAPPTYISPESARELFTVIVEAGFSFGGARLGY